MNALPSTAQLTAGPGNGRAKTARWLFFLLILAASAALGSAAIRHGIAEHWAASSKPDRWQAAANLEPANPDNWYRLGRYRQLDFENGDVAQAISDYRRAAAIEPGNSLYWLDLAGAYESTGDSQAAEQAYLTAQRDYPISGEVAWRYGNFLLRQNRTEEAFRQIQHAVLVDPSLAPAAISRTWHSSQDVDRVLSSALPPNEAAYWAAVDFFVRSNQPDAAMDAWKRLASYHPSFPLQRPAALLDLLIQSGRAENARTVWQQTLSAAGITPPPVSNGSLIWDGGFEGDLLNAEFTWNYRPVQGAELHWDEQTVHSGRRSLQIAFDGSENLNFEQIWQFVVVEPATRYRFSSYTRTDDLTTDSGIRFEIRSVDSGGPPAGTPNVVGTQPWTLDDVEFTTGPRTHLLQVILRRAPSGLLSNKIRGTVWVDDVSLVPLAFSTTR